MKGVSRIFLAGALGLTVAGCGTAAPAGPAPVTITVLAAASLSTAFPAIAAKFHQAHSSVTVRFSFAGTQTLVTQIENGAPADVFASADQAHMATLLSEGKVRSPLVFARNRLAIIVPKNNPAGITQPLDLGRAGVKLDLAGPAVPAGKSARDLLAKIAATAGSPSAFISQAAKNTVSEEDNVEAVVSRIALGEADAGIVYASDLATPNGKSVQSIAIPDSINVISVYPIATVAGTGHAAEAAAFLDYVRGQTGQSLLRQDGFLPPAS
ncbi:MAG: molybdate ABC transporter substrate-binding protein [Candidatus Dormibacteraeota bacterium]|nr:molybdate ABC transporter substrate-binding protein [Candidatus Dormibacteraeota bacterium]